jgi:hypothetical protein
MPGKGFLVLSLVTMAMGPAINDAHAGEINIGISVPVPAPPKIVLPAPPRVVVVPNSPVSYAPNVDVNLFVYGGRYYTFHDGEWFHARTHNGPWAFIATNRVPKPVIAVPVTYYKVPPGHAKKMARQHAAPGGSEGFCPPGQAKKGRC